MTPSAAVAQRPRPAPLAPALDPVPTASHLPCAWPISGPGAAEMVTAAIVGLVGPEAVLVDRLSRATGDRHEAIALHGLRVGILAERLAGAMGLGGELAASIRRAAILHDIGKLAVPAWVLLKPGRLDQEEYALSKLHTVLGADLLRQEDSPAGRLAHAIALHHHERWDGLGYPDGLAGDAIPLPARVVSVADVFDALTHERVYKAAWADHEALQEVARQRGRHHDPAVVDALLRLHGGSYPGENAEELLA